MHSEQPLSTYLHTVDRRHSAGQQTPKKRFKCEPNIFDSDEEYNSFWSISVWAQWNDDLFSVSGFGRQTLQCLDANFYLSLFFFSTSHRTIYHWKRENIFHFRWNAIALHECLGTSKRVWVRISPACNVILILSIRLHSVRRTNEQLWRCVVVPACVWITSTRSALALEVSRDDF